MPHCLTSDANCTSNVWYSWTAYGINTTCTSSSNVTTSITGGVWRTWTSNSTTGSIVLSEVQGTEGRIWGTWVESSDHLTRTYQQAFVPDPPPDPAEMERRVAALEKARKEAEQRLKEEQKKRKKAERRARSLLYKLLHRDQIRSYVRKKFFDVEAPSGKTYRLRKGWAGNVEELNKEGKPFARFCIHPGVHVPEEDNLLAQKLMLETDEEGFRRTANRTLVPVYN